MTSILFKFFSTFLNIQALLLDAIPIQINYWYYTLIFVLKKAGTKVLASQLFLDCRARRSG